MVKIQHFTKGRMTLILVIETLVFLPVTRNDDVSAVLEILKFSLVLLHGRIL